MLVRNKWERIGSVHEVLEILYALRSGEKQAVLTASYLMQDTNTIIVEPKVYLRILTLLGVTGILAMVMIVLFLGNPLLDRKNDSFSYFNLQHPLIYKFNHFSIDRKRDSDLYQWKENSTDDKFQIIGRDGSRYWQHLRKDGTDDILIAEIKFGADGRSMYASHLSFNSESDTTNCISTECFSFKPQSYLWLPYLPGTLRYYNRMPIALWKNSDDEGGQNVEPVVMGEKIKPSIGMAFKYADWGEENAVLASSNF